MSIRDVSGDSGSFTFWMSSNDADLFFALNGKCSNCVGETLIQYDQKKCVFEVVESGQNVHDILNIESAKQRYDMAWTKDLDLIVKPIVVINGLFNSYFVVETGAQLVEIGNLSSYFDDGLHGFVSGECETRVVFNSAYVVTQSIELTLGLMASVTVGEPIKATKQMIAGETLEQAFCLFGFVFDDFFVVDAGTIQLLDKSTIIERNMTLRLCHHVTVSGLVISLLMTDHGTRLSEIDSLTPFFDPQFIVYDADNATNVYDGDTFVHSDMEIVISDATKQDISIRFDGSTNPTVDEIKDAITGIIDLGDEEHIWITVTPQDDGSFVVSVIQSGGQTNDVAGALRECTKSQN